ncbi:hypothetical protein CBR_g34486 [Chara braunii]|uniref:DDE Tnp4 domain-containing protein n=1 Tax=Chara braunii TaxID=69332 RepID=A0A388LIY5_CHABU|nr:hypothetical protein CBR_g34486 [Chara braunii]|eukprot:GBG82203.1 hypothetical protein CBR_g34486 [Chara braunii]
MLRSDVVAAHGQVSVRACLRPTRVSFAIGLRISAALHRQCVKCGRRDETKTLVAFATCKRRGGGWTPAVVGGRSNRNRVVGPGCLPDVVAGIFNTWRHTCTEVGGGGRRFLSTRDVMDGCDGDGPVVLSTTEKTAVAAAVVAVVRVCDDATEDYFREKLRMSRRVFMEISEASAPHVQRQVTFYREPLQPEQIVAYALYRWATRESYDNSTSSFGMGRSSGVRAVRDVTAAILRVYGEKISWPTGVRKQVVLRAFLGKGFPNCHGAVDCTYIYVDKTANAPSENYFDREHRFSVIAHVVVDLDLRVLDVFVGYPGSCHDIRVIQLSSLSRRAEEGLLFRGPHVTLPGGVTTNGYILGDNGYPPSEWVVVPYGGINQHPDEERFDTKQKVASGAVERAFGRLKGMWRLFLWTHKTNLESLSQQFTAVCILHNILLDAGIEFDDNLLWEVDVNGVRR